MSETFVVPRPGLYIGGLRKDLHPARLAGLISNLIWKFQVPCAKQNVHIVISKVNAYALVDLPDEESKAYLLSELSDITNVVNVFDLYSITNNPYDFRAAPRFTQNAKRKRSKSRAKKSRSRQANINNADAASGEEELSFPLLYEAADVAWYQKGEERAVRGKKRSETSLHSSGSSSAKNKTLKNQVEQSSHSRGSSQGMSLFERSSILPVLQSVSRGRTMQIGSVDSIRPVSLSAHGQVNLNTQKCAATSTTGLPSPVQVSTTTSTPGTSTGLPSGFYRVGEVVGRESRHSEFKAGGMSQKDKGWLQDTVGKYVCGFLNSGEGGTLYMGVNDSGRVIGFPCTQALEDDYRLVIDEAIKSIEPSIFPDRYTVRFVPIMEEDGCLSDHLQVLEIYVSAIGFLKNLYDFRGHAYIRRDGSLQGPLKARQVQEWTRKQMEQERLDNWQLKTQLHELSIQLENEQKKNKEMREKLEDMTNEVPLEQKKSRICNIM